MSPTRILVSLSGVAGTLLSVAGAFAVGCMEVGLTPSGPAASEVGHDTGEGGHGHADPLPEGCNGEDDDLDGQVDEGSPDVDGDGVADCVDEDCEVVGLDATSVDVDAGCIGWQLDVEDPWDLVVEWHWAGAPSVVMPVVINLTDDDGDGDIDARDVPDIVINDYASGRLVALDGLARRVLWEADGFRADAGVAAADLDMDGRPEIVSVTGDNRVRALEHDGRVAWTTDDVFPMLYPVPTITDLEGDGQPEVIADVGVVSGRDGTTRFRLSVGRSGPWRAPVVADLDRDGTQEILLAGRVFGSDGRARWEAPVPGDALAAFPAVVQLDGDPQAEVAWAVGTSLRLYEHDGRLRSDSPLSPRGRPGPLCAGDLDGDGVPEVVVPASDRLLAFGADGEPRWSAPVRDSSGASGCVAFDMDGDAVFEVIYADMQAISVFDGRTGALRYDNAAHASVTYFETPVVADIDDDGSAEILVASSGPGHVGVTAFGHAEDGWPPAGPVWPVHDYYVTNVTDGGSVPTGGDPGWHTWGVFRGRPATGRSGLPDLAVDIVDDCIASCEPGGLLRLSVQVRNEGQRDVGAGHLLMLQGVEGKNRVPLRTVPLPAIPAGTALVTRQLDLPWTLAPAGGLEVVVDPGGLVAECDEGDNVARWVHGRCP